MFFGVQVAEDALAEDAQGDGDAGVKDGGVRVGLIEADVVVQVGKVLVVGGGEVGQRGRMAGNARAILPP